MGSSRTERARLGSKDILGDPMLLIVNSGAFQSIPDEPKISLVGGEVRSNLLEVACFDSIGATSVLAMRTFESRVAALMSNRDVLRADIHCQRGREDLINR